ncbi:DUF397 domain-containing protein [Streptomyces avicenniae]|uniref:DUF397 domain-containing protein n=1 Tax=Streptomyces avicenniae TaxID=500153 RepID=UPI00069BA7C0|nr:DUF397 domain-containing protein [Streptomyces avicenniae]
MSTSTDLSAATWQTSTYSDEQGGNCVEVARNLPGVHPVRDTKNRTGPVLTFTTPTWGTFLNHLK